MLVHYTMVNGIPTGIEDDLELSPMTVWPNPTADMLHVACSQAKEDAIFVQVYDIYGKLCYTEQLWGGNGTVNISNLPASVYVMKCQSGHNILDIRKIVKE